MKNTILFTTLSLVILLTFSACGTSNTAMTDEQMAKQYEMSLEELQEMKEAAARMGMSIEDHMKMMGHDHK